jgi:hypothetical protein
MIRIGMHIGLVMALAGGAAMAQTYTVERLNNGQPVIDRQMFDDAGHSNWGRNINGPSVIRVPDWISPADRPDPSAQYYMYFANHGGNFIRMAWAEKVDGPYTLHGVHDYAADNPRGVLDLGSDDRIDLANGLAVTGHIASPDVHVDHDNKRIRMYFHAPAQQAGSGRGQKSFVAHSGSGLDFNAGIEPVILGFAYFRVFDYKDDKYAIASRGALYKAPDDPFTPPAGFNYRHELWDLEGSGYNDNPFQHDLNADADRDPTGRVRHSAVRVVGDKLQVFHSRVGDKPERIVMTTIDLSVGDLTQWDPAYPPEEILEPELDWEGADLELGTSSAGSATNVRQLRDPYVFEDADGKLYLFYTGEGEGAIGVARLIPEPTTLGMGLLAAPFILRRRR